MDCEFEQWIVLQRTFVILPLVSTCRLLPNTTTVTIEYNSSYHGKQNKAKDMERYETLGKTGDQDLRRNGTVHVRSDKSSVKTKVGVTVTTKAMKQPSQRDETRRKGRQTE